MAVTWKKLAFDSEVVKLSTLAAKGDIFVASGAGAVTRLAIGTDGYLLKVATDTPGWVNPTTLAVAAHASTHKNSGSDELLLSDFGEPTAAVKFDGYQATNLIVHNVADAAAKTALTAVIGKMAFQVDELSLYLCTVAA